MELKSISAIVVAMVTVMATIAEEWFPYDRNDYWTFSPAILAIVAIIYIWKPAYRTEVAVATIAEEWLPYDRNDR